MSDTYQEIKVIEKIINNMEKLFYSPYIYKICTLKPEDIYDLFSLHSFSFFMKYFE